MLSPWIPLLFTNNGLQTGGVGEEKDLLDMENVIVNGTLTDKVIQCAPVPCSLICSEAHPKIQTQSLLNLFSDIEANRAGLDIQLSNLRREILVRRRALPYSAINPGITSGRRPDNF